MSARMERRERAVVPFLGRESTLRRLYRTEEERQLFRMMVEGASAEEAREHIQQSTLTLRAAPTGEIEIF